MLPVSPTFLAAIRGSHRIVVKATLCNPPGQIGVLPTGTDLAVVGGSVTLDGTADVRGSLELEVTEPWPRQPTYTSLAPYGAEVFLSRGIDLGNGRIERAPLGYYRLDAVEQGRFDGPLQLTGRDRMAGIVESRLLLPVQYAASATYAGVVTGLVQDVYPGATIDFTWPAGYTALTTLGRSVVAEEDRFAFLDELVESIGAIWYWDYRGRLVVKPAPSPTVTVWRADAGSNGVLVAVSRARNRDGVYNAVVAKGQALDDVPPVYAIAYDTNPSSTTWWSGPYGKVPRFFASPLLTTTAQAQQAADALLRRSTGLPYEVGFSQVVNPALEPFDAVEVAYPVTPGGFAELETHVLDSVTVPLESDGAMACRTRLSVVGA